MGVNRSGTNALRESLSKDADIYAFNEHKNNAFFVDYYLRSEKETRKLIQKSEKPILLKPINETRKRSIDEVLKEYKDYEVKIIWIYRDPVNVHQSQKTFFNKPPISYPKYKNVDWFIKEWNKRNSEVLSVRKKYECNMIIVRYEDLISDPSIFWNTCRFAKIKGKYLFRKDSLNGRRILSKEVKTKIDRETFDVLKYLDKNRTFKSSAISRRFNFGHVKRFFARRKAYK